MRLVIALLGLIAVITVAGGVYLVSIDKDIPEAIVAIGGTTIGALGGLLSQTNATPTPVQMYPVPMQPEERG